MKQKLIALITLPALLAFATGAQANHHEKGENKEHTVVIPNDLQWQDGPPSLAEGAEYVILEGDPTKKGIFTMRIKLPTGFKIQPHTHPKVERVTVIDGQFKLGQGREFREDELENLPAGGFFTMPPGMEHFAAVTQETIIQLTGEGPWEIKYINPQDDPRNTAE